MQVEKGDVTYLEKGLLKIKSFASFLQHFSPSCTWKATCVSCLPLQIQILQGNKQVAAGKVSTQSDKLDVWKRLHTVFLDASLCLSPNLWRMADLTPYDSYLLQFPAVALLETFEHESAPVFMLNPKKTPSCIIWPSFLSLVLKSWLQATFIIVAWSESEKISPERWCNPVAFSVSHKKVLDVQESFSEPLRLCPLAQMRASSERLKV